MSTLRGRPDHGIRGSSHGACGLPSASTGAGLINGLRVALALLSCLRAAVGLLKGLRLRIGPLGCPGSPGPRLLVHHVKVSRNAAPSRHAP